VYRERRYFFIWGRSKRSVFKEEGSSGVLSSAERKLLQASPPGNYYVIKKLGSMEEKGSAGNKGGGDFEGR